MFGTIRSKLMPRVVTNSDGVVRRPLSSCLTSMTLRGRRVISQRCLEKPSQLCLYILLRLVSFSFENDAYFQLLFQFWLITAHIFALANLNCADTSKGCTSLLRQGIALAEELTTYLLHTTCEPHFVQPHGCENRKFLGFWRQGDWKHLQRKESATQKIRFHERLPWRGPFKLVNVNKTPEFDIYNVEYSQSHL